MVCGLSLQVDRVLFRPTTSSYIRKESCFTSLRNDAETTEIMSCRCTEEGQSALLGILGLLTSCLASRCISCRRQQRRDKALADVHLTSRPLSTPRCRN